MAEVFYEHASELATVSNTFTVDGAATDPTTISLIVTDPDGDATTYTYADEQITKVSTGVYRKDISCATAGRWQAVWVGTGAASDVAVLTWDVFDTDQGALYCTIEALKSRVGLAATDVADDLELRLAVESVSREIDDWCRQRFDRVEATRTFAADGLYDVTVGALVSVTALKTDVAGDGTFEATWDAGDYQLRPTDVAHHAETRPYTAIRAIGTRLFPCHTGIGRDDRVQIEGVFGWPQVPAAVRQAALILAHDAFKSKDAPFGVAGFGDFGPIRIRGNPKATALLAPYRRLPVLVG